MTSGSQPISHYSKSYRALQGKVCAMQEHLQKTPKNVIVIIQLQKNCHPDSFRTTVHPLLNMITDGNPSSFYRAVGFVRLPTDVTSTVSSNQAPSRHTRSTP